MRSVYILIFTIISCAFSEELERSGTIVDSNTQQIKKSKLNIIPAEKSKTKVTIELERVVELPEGPGFRIFVSGWVPNGKIVIYGISQSGEQVAIIGIEDAVKVSPKGTAVFSVPFVLRGFHVGEWMLLIAGEGGKHSVNIQIPKVIPPNNDCPSWQLDFSAIEE